MYPIEPSRSGLAQNDSTSAIQPSIFPHQNDISLPGNSTLQSNGGNTSQFMPGSNTNIYSINNGGGSFYQRQQQQQPPLSVSLSSSMSSNVSIAAGTGSNDNPLLLNKQQPIFTNTTTATPNITSQTDVAAAMSEAMEKLSDSMKRTAMSRSMVKQFSGRSIVRNGSSSRLLASQRLSQRAVLRQQASDKSLLGGDSGRSIRRTNSKHHLQHRFFPRHDSQQSLGQSGHNSKSFDGASRIGTGF